MNKYVLVINDSECQAVRVKGSKTNQLSISGMPESITATLNKYMVSDRLDFDLNDPELDRDNLEQSEGSLEDKREKMLSDSLKHLLPVLDSNDRLFIFASDRYVGKAKKEVESKNQSHIFVHAFSPIGANPGEKEKSILDKLDSLC